MPVDADGKIGPGEVLVRIDTCGICGTDLKKIHTGSHSAPRIFGHEMAGTIAMVGEGVTGFAVGDRVMSYHHIPCGECYYCRKQTFAQCETYKNVGCTAGFAPAARRLGFSPSAVTRLVAGLEARLGARLLQRTTRSVTLTDAGVRYLERARRILAEVAEAEAAAQAERTVPAGRLGTPDDIAHAVSFLASEGAGFITGQRIVVDGGRSLGS